MQLLKPSQSRISMIMVSLLFGYMGIHRLMMGYSDWWLMFITGGGLGIWYFYDLFRIIAGSMKMADGRDLT
jgi:hypothetical protein